MQIDLDQTERRITLFALQAIKPIIQEPKTGYKIRQSYKDLISKLKRDEKLSDKIQVTL